MRIDRFQNTDIQTKSWQTLKGWYLSIYHYGIFTFSINVEMEKQVMLEEF